MARLRIFAVGVACLVVLAGQSLPAIAAEQAPLATPLVGPAFPASLTGLTSQGEAHLVVNGQPREVPLSELYRWGAQADSAQGDLALLVDGSLLQFRLNHLTNGVVHGESSSFGEIKIPLEKLRAIVLQPPGEAHERDQLFERAMAFAQPHDEVLLEGGDSFTGAVLELTAADPQLAIEVKGVKRLVPQRRVQAVLVNAALAEKPRLERVQWKLGLRNGSLLAVHSAAATENEATFTLACELQLKLDEEPARFWRRACYLAPRCEKCVFLSDLPPLGYKHAPYLSLEWPYRLDRNVLGGRLRSGGAVYEKGLGMHASSRLAFAIPAGYGTFRAEAALDDSAQAAGSVIFRVYLEQGEGKWQLAFESGQVRGGDAPVAINVAVGQARGLALIVDSADRGHVLDRANWLGARLLP